MYTTYKGVRDFIFDDFKRLNFVFNKWRKVCRYYGFEEYIIPLIEYAALYKAKSGEELGNKQLYEFTDKGGRQIAIRPEATPSVARMLAKIYKIHPKPFRIFSILNFMRYERPQTGRMREFWQLNVDIVGSDTLESDIQIVSVALELILAFDPPEGAFKLYISSRQLIEEVFKALGVQTPKMRSVLLSLLDHFSKVTWDYIEDKLRSHNIPPRVSEFIRQLYTLYSQNAPEAEYWELLEQQLGVQGQGIKRVKELLEAVKEDERYAPYVGFNPAIVRGLDYYDGVVFEAFDTHPKNRRALLGGGIYNTLGALFNLDMPAVGFAIGNYTFMNFLDNWELWPESLTHYTVIFVPLLKGMRFRDYSTLLRSEWLRTQLREHYGIKNPSFVLSHKVMGIKEALRYAAKRNYHYVLIYGEREKNAQRVNLRTLVFEHKE